MADPFIPPPSSPASSAQGQSWLSRNKYVAGGGAILLLIIGYAYLKNKGSSSASTANNTASGTTANPSVYEVAPGYLSSGQDGGYNGYNTGGYNTSNYSSSLNTATDQSINSNTDTGIGVTGQATQNQTGGLTPTSAATLATEQQKGGGYFAPAGSSSVTTPQGVYNWVATGPQATADQQAGVQLYYQVAPGSFAQVPAGAVTGPGGWFVNGQPTPLFTQNPAQSY